MKHDGLNLSGVVLIVYLSLSLPACSTSLSTSNTTKPGLPAYEGFVDDVSCEAITAWGWDKNRPNDAVKLDFYDGNVLLDTVTAGALRQDLVNAGKGNGKHYVLWPVPIQLKDGIKHDIKVKFGGTAIELPLAKPMPKDFTCGLER